MFLVNVNSKNIRSLSFFKQNGDLDILRLEEEKKRKIRRRKPLSFYPMVFSFTFSGLVEAFNKTTPPIINIKPTNVMVLNRSFHTSTPISAVIAVPMPDQMA